MGRHSQPDESDGPDYSGIFDAMDRADHTDHADHTDRTGRIDHSAPDNTGSRPGASSRRRTVAISTALVLAVATGAVVVLRGGLLPSAESCRSNAVRLSVAASPDIAPALRTVADHARRAGIRSDGRCLDVKVSSRPAYEVANALGDAGRTPGFQVWVPDSGVWVERAATSPVSAAPLDTLGGIASSPVAVAATSAAADRLGWPEKTYDWAQLAAAGSGGGSPRLGTADPARSAAGLLALSRINGSIAKAGAADGKAATDARAAANAKLLSQRAARTDAALLETVPRRNQAVVLSEQAAFAHNADADDASRLELFYPKDGTAELDYPYTVLNDRELTTVRARAATRFLTLLTDARGRRALKKEGFRTADGKVSEPVARAAGGRTPQPYAVTPSPGPSAREVEAALGMWTITVQSARLNTVVDASASMSDPVPGRAGQSRMDVTKASLRQALSRFNAGDEIGLWEFSTELDGDRDYRELVATRRLGARTPDGTGQREELAAAFDALKPLPEGSTGLYDTTLAAYKKAQETFVRGKFNAVVMLTDGANQDPGSISRGALVKELKRLVDPDRPVPLIAIAVGPDADRAACREIAQATGGSAQQVNDPAQINTAMLKAIVAAGEAGAG
ncbi:VWA domain-containing protein [Streptomyces botrytidirepellens]|uniref:VWA domain-containing protein n=2 Tax=Streptomyces botrytidirepellens TaxID=2486417 RepID=A0A3M8T870_9ACTN|nr:substrate-binding domain-containing protein [Streptomyces botrytidirepellens]RNF86862.1 VWA domain-containing protein [Streptomyces botrytidirepellens]